VKLRGIPTSALLGCALAALPACGPTGFDGRLKQAVRKQGALDANRQDLWERNPSADAGDPSLTLMTANFDAIKRTAVSLEDILEKNLPLEGTKLKVFQSSEYQYAPSLFDWAGKRVPWANPDFHIYMAYHYGTKARQYAASALSETAGVDMYRYSLTLYASEEGGLGDTYFDSSDKTIRFTRAAVVTGKPEFKAADDVDTVYHEMGHFIQNQLNPELQQSVAGSGYFRNYLLKALREGLADFGAAAMLGQDKINDWPMKHVKLFGLSAVPYMDSATYTRAARNEVYFPEGFSGAPSPCYEASTACGFYDVDKVTDASHSDGRAVSGALNDFRRLLAGGTIKLFHGCTGAACDYKLAEGVFSDADAWKAVYRVAHEAYKDLLPTSSLYFYGDKLVDRCEALSWCSTPISTALKIVLNDRGIYDGKALVTNDDPSNVFTLPPPSLPGYRVLADKMLDDYYGAVDDTFLDPCEAMLIWPNIAVKATVKVYSVSVKILEISGFSDLKSSEGVPYEFSTSVGTTYKNLGWMELGQSSDTLVSSDLSNWYKIFAGRTFATRAKLADYVLEATPKLNRLGWLVRAPKSRTSPNHVGKVKWQISYRVYNSDVVRSTPRTYEFEQQVTTQDGSGRSSPITFCAQGE
jgi:hypothetical protein